MWTRRDVGWARVSGEVFSHLGVSKEGVHECEEKGGGNYVLHLYSLVSLIRCGITIYCMARNTDQRARWAS